MMDDLVEVASMLLHTPAAAVTLIDESRQWFKAAVGIDVTETPRSVAFCDHTIRIRSPLIVNDATEDERFTNNPLVVGAPHVRAYAGVPLRVGGTPIGALCVIDTRVRSFTEDEISALVALGRTVERIFELRWRRLLSSPVSGTFLADLAAGIETIDDFYRTVPETCPAWIFDRSSLRFLAVNDSAVEQYGWSRKQFLEMTITDIRPAEEIPALKAMIANGLPPGGDPLGRIWRHRRADGIETRVQTAYAAVKSELLDAALVMVSDLTARDQGRAALDHAAVHDPLTGLPNRTGFNRHVTQLIAHVPDRTLALLFVDLDGFKLVNDTAGHAAGDLVLAVAARRILGSIRYDDHLARMGGDEFAIVCDGATLQDASEIAQRIADSLREPLMIGAREHRLSASIGIALNTVNSTAEELLIEADLAMFAAKSAGRGTVAVFDQELRNTVSQRAATEHHLNLAIARGEFELHYQPIVGLTSEAVHVEALLRWNHPTRGLLGPGEFLSIAEVSGLIIPIGSWVLREAAAASVRFIEINPRIRVAFNLATQQLRHALVAEVETVLAATGADARHLIAEVTESGLTTKEAGLVTRQLQRLGIAISIDDFGTGYSSLSRLRELDVDALKLDRCFIAELDNQRGRRMVSAIVQLARAIDAPIVAEGVETNTQLVAVASLGCDYAQGYFLARPLPEAEVRTWLRRHALPKESVDAATAGAMLGRSFDVPTEVTRDFATINHGLARPRLAAARRDNARTTNAERTSAASIVAVEASALAATASPDDSPVTSMLRGLLRIRAPHQAARLLQDAAVALGGSLASAADAGPDALPLDLSLGEGSPVLVEADPISTARMQIERFLPRLTEDAREAVDLLRHNERAEDASNTDRLTGLANRRVLDRALPRADDGAVILIDLDHFKEINDTEGHLAGDAVLADFGRMLGNELRTIDVCCRFGGEEFVIIATGMTTTEAVELTARLRRAWGQAAVRTVTFSAGVAAIGPTGAVDALASADRALYRAKELGRDRTETEFEAVAERDR
ncbi:MAG: diguanylate cyclase [Acidimicrobiales bacterium]